MNKRKDKMNMGMARHSAGRLNLIGRVLSVLVLMVLFSGRIAQGATIDIMIVYDTTATTWVENDGGGMEAFSQDAVNRMNLAMENSDVDLLFQLAHSVSVNYTHDPEVDEYLNTALNTVTNGDGPFSDIHILRDEYGADLVALLVDTGTPYGYVGSGWTIWSIDGTPDYAFTCNAIRSVDLSDTLTHEVGHNLGAHHAKNQLSGPGPNIYLDNQYSAGWYFTGTDTSEDYHTIMAYCDDGYGNTYWPAPLFSTPLVTYEGTPAGDPLYGDNARLLRDTMDVVAAYRSAVGSLEVTIEPTEVRAAGAQWRRVGTDIWLNSGVLENNLPTGDHIVEFKAVIGWDQPANVNVKILSGQTTTAMGTYTLPESDIEFNENFESYDLNAWPDSWIKDANAIDLLNNYIAADLTNSENKVLRIYGEIGGCWPAIAYQQFTYANNFYIEYTVYNGSENLTGCNPVRGEVGLRQGASLDSGHSRILLSFLENGDAQAADGSMLGNYALNQWHDILIHYQRKESALNLAYTIEGEFLQEIAVVVENTANEQLLDHLAVSAQEGPVYFDDISFYQHKKRAMPWIQLLLLN